MAQTPAMLSKDVLWRIKEYVAAHLEEPIGVAALARLSGRSPFHFTRVFTSSVGVTPHRYVVRLRLRRAVELLREGRFGLGDIALRTGFADQSHLSRWIRRVYGLTPTQLVSRGQREKQQESSRSEPGPSLHLLVKEASEERDFADTLEARIP